MQAGNELEIKVSWLTSYCIMEDFGDGIRKMKIMLVKMSLMGDDVRRNIFNIDLN